MTGSGLACLKIQSRPTLPALRNVENAGRRPAILLGATRAVERPGTEDFEDWEQYQALVSRRPIAADASLPRID